jgi:hypothetical protein
MMGACREGCDLLNKNGRRVFIRDLFKWRRFNRDVWRDTFGRILCWLSGRHTIHQNFENNEVETSCTTCCQWLEQDGYKWKEKK